MTVVAPLLLGVLLAVGGSAPPPAGEGGPCQEEITLNLQDADLRDTILNLAQLCHLNVGIDAEVRGAVTLELKDVSIEKALGLVLSRHGLARVPVGRLVRIAPIQKLLAETNR